jgi:hypothetical protein
LIINRPYNPKLLNLYVVRNPRKLSSIRNVECNCLTSPQMNTIICDGRFVEAIAYSFDQRKGREDRSEDKSDEDKEIMEVFANTRSSSILHWLIGHEIGHVYHHHDSLARGFLGFSELKSEPSIGLPDLIHDARIALIGSSAVSPAESSEYSLRNIEIEADDFVIKAIPPSELWLNLYNFSGLLQQIMKPLRAKPAADDKIVASFNPHYHPDLDYRALRMANEAIRTPPMPKTDDWDYYQKLLLRYELKETNKPVERACQVLTSLEKAASRRTDYDEQNKLVLKLLFSALVDGLGKNPDPLRLDVALNSIGGTQSPNFQAIPKDYEWMLLWILALRADSPTSAQLQIPIQKIKSSLPKIPAQFIPAYIRLAKIYAAGSLGSNTERGIAPLFEGVFAGVSIQGLRDYFTQAISEVLNSDKADFGVFFKSVVAYEAVGLFGKLDELEAYSNPKVSFFWPLAGAILQTVAHGHEGPLQATIVHPSALRHRAPMLMDNDNIALVSNLISSRAATELSEKNERNFSIAAQFVEAALDARVPDIVATLLPLAQNSCQQSADCSSDDWRSVELRALVRLHKEEEAVQRAVEAPTMFWQTAKERPFLLSQIQEGLRSKTAYERWAKVLDDKGAELLEDKQFQAKLPCLLLGTRTAAGIDVAETVDECMNRVLAYSASKCDPISSTDADYSVCYLMLEAVMEGKLVSGKSEEAFVYMRNAEQMYQAMHKEPIDAAHMFVLINGESQSWEALRTRLSNERNPR